jgi:hypothetical protein
MAIILYIVTIGVFASILEIELTSVILIASIGLAITVIEMFCSKNKKIMILLNIIITLSVITAIIIFNDTVIDGFKLICNNLFSVSEKYQLYKYDMFEVSTSETAVNTAYLCITVILSMLCSITAVYRNFVLLAIGFVFVIEVQIYFGVFPSAVWNVIYFVALVVSILGDIKKEYITLAVTFIVICLVCVFFTNDSPELHNFSEQIRDMFDEKLENPIPDEITHNDNFDEQISHEQFRKDDSNNIDYSNANEFHTNIEQDQSGAEVGLTEPSPNINWLLIILLIPLVILIILICKKISLTVKFSSSDYRKAINSMFMYLMKLYERRGLIPENTLYSNYSEQIEKIIPDYTAAYSEIVELWEEAIYSNHTITVEHRDKMRELLSHTRKLI